MRHGHTYTRVQLFQTSSKLLQSTFQLNVGSKGNLSIFWGNSTSSNKSTIFLVWKQLILIFIKLQLLFYPSCPRPKVRLCAAFVFIAASLVVLAGWCLTSYCSINFHPHIHMNVVYCTVVLYHHLRLGKHTDREHFENNKWQLLSSKEAFNIYFTITGNIWKQNDSFFF